MDRNRRLTPDERYVIEQCLRRNYDPSEIAKLIERSISTVTREIERNQMDSGRYNSAYAQRQSDQRAKNLHRHVRITLPQWNIIEACVREDHSPEQISGRMKADAGFSVSYERIYQHIAADAKNGGDLYKHLRQGRKIRKHRCRKTEDRRGKIINRIGIEMRPPIVDERCRVGDWEIDTIVSRESKHVLVTAVERTSLATIIELVPSREAAVVTESLINRMLSLKKVVHTITSDNGKEFAGHELIAKKLSALFYFAHPYQSWERGTGENANGLIRQYFPKKTDFSKISKRDVARAERMLNNRPRKSLNYKSAAEYFLEQTGFPLPMGRGRRFSLRKLYNQRSLALAA